MPIHPSFPFVWATSPHDPANPAQTVLLPNENALPTAGTFAESFEEVLPCRMEFVTKFGPQISLLPVPIFGVNTYINKQLPRVITSELQRTYTPDLTLRNIQTQMATRNSETAQP
jgi:hypothetical protein